MKAISSLGVRSPCIEDCRILRAYCPNMYTVRRTTHSTLRVQSPILYVTASYWYWVMLLEILRPPADSNVAIKDTLQLACSQKISPSALVVELGRHAGNDYHQFQFAAIFGQAIDNS